MFVDGTEKTFGSIFTLLSQVSPAARFHSSVSSHDEMAKRQEVGSLDKGGDHVWIPFLAQFASTLRRDLKAVELSITTPAGRFRRRVIALPHPQRCRG
jgi:hypothetical protein